MQSYGYTLAPSVTLCVPPSSRRKARRHSASLILCTAVHFTKRCAFHFKTEGHFKLALASISPTRSVLEVCSADKVAFVDTMRGAYPYALATAGTFIIVDSCKVIYDGNSTVGAGLLALAAGNTAVLTVLSGDGTLVVIRAFYNDARGIVYELNNAVRTFSGTYTAADTFTGVDASNAVLYRNSVLGAGSYTVAES